jgi:hypothetical protein
MSFDRKVYNRNYYLKNKAKIDNAAKIWNLNNKELRKETRKKHYLKNKEKLKKQFNEYYLSNRENKQIKNQAYYQNNKEIIKEKCKVAGKIYHKNHPEKSRAKSAKRRAVKLQQTPKWADLKAIEQFYKNCPNGYEVDHIIPLKGKNVRGLHILENLQYLLKTENRSKGNRI